MSNMYPIMPFQIWYTVFLEMLMVIMTVKKFAVFYEIRNC